MELNVNIHLSKYIKLQTAIRIIVLKMKQLSWIIE